MDRRDVLVAILRAVRLYGFVAWAYIAANSINHPATLQLHLTHFANWPHENTFGVACFVLSAVAFLAVEVTKDQPG